MAYINKSLNRLFNNKEPLLLLLLTVLYYYFSKLHRVNNKTIINRNGVNTLHPPNLHTVPCYLV